MVTPNTPSKEFTTKEAERFYRANKKGDAGSAAVIKRFLAGRDAVVFGARAVNRRLPDHLDKHTEDWDILTGKDPEKIARKIEVALDKRYGGNFFFVEPALHPGTFKVKSRVTGRTVADVSGFTEVIPSVEINNINYATLDHQVKNIRRSLADEGSTFRHDKDRETLQRINIYRANHPDYYVSDLREVLGKEFDAKLVRLRSGVFMVAGVSGPINKKQLNAVEEFIVAFYPQLEFELVNGRAVIREVGVKIDRKRLTPLIRRRGFGRQ